MIDESAKARLGETQFYSNLARWWPLISPVEDYAEEAEEFARILRDKASEAREVLELGSGGGHNAAYLKRHFALTLSDLSPDMLALSERLNPECEHAQGDMRTLRLGRLFDAVFVHDAVEYMTTEGDLALAMATAFAHCRPGAIALFACDSTTETFTPETECGGSDGPDGAGARYLEWTYDPDPADNQVTTEYSFIFREPDGSVGHVAETHTFGLFSQETWLRLLREAGFVPEVVVERTTEARAPRLLFVGRRP
jgi:SAM-dependent methyltransferase